KDWVSTRQAKTREDAIKKLGLDAPGIKIESIEVRPEEPDRRGEMAARLGAIQAHQLVPVRLPPLPERWVACYRREDHSPATCETCGFHGFTDPGARDYEVPGDRNVVGVIEAFGKITRGTRGFRAEKARIVGLALPRKRWREVRRRIDRASFWLVRHPWVNLIAVLASFALIVGNIALWDSLLAPVFGGLLGLIFGRLFLVAVTGKRWGTRIWAPPGTQYHPGRRGAARWTIAAEEPDLFERVRANYPEVQIFRSRRGLVRAFGIHTPPPPPPPPLPTPETADGFWELNEKEVVR